MLLEIEIIAKLAGFFFHAAEAYSESFQMSSMKLLFKRLTTIHFFPVNTKYKYMAKMHHRRTLRQVKC